MHVLTLTAAEIATVTQSRQHGPMECELLELCARLKHESGGSTVLVRLDYPGEPSGGIELRCRRRRESWWGRLLWRLSGAPLGLW